MKALFLLTLVSLTSVAMAKGGHSPLLSLPEHAAIKFNSDFVVTSMASRSGTPVQALIKTIQIDLRGKTVEAAWSRFSNVATINKLKTLRNFKTLESVFCFVDFNADVNNDILITKGSTFKLTNPVDFGTPSEKFTKTGKRIRLENYADKSISGSFEHKLLRRLYCNFKANASERYNETYLDDLKISHLEALLAPMFELKY